MRCREARRGVCAGAHLQAEGGGVQRAQRGVPRNQRPSRARQHGARRSGGRRAGCASAQRNVTGRGRAAAICGCCHVSAPRQLQQRRKTAPPSSALQIRLARRAECLGWLPTRPTSQPCANELQRASDGGPARAASERVGRATRAAAGVLLLLKRVQRPGHAALRAFVLPRVRRALVHSANQALPRGTLRRERELQPSGAALRVRAA